MLNPPRFPVGTPSPRVHDHLAVVKHLNQLATIMRLESEVRCLKGEEDARIAAAWASWERSRRASAEQVAVA
jgi:hypothetical protein